MYVTDNTTIITHTTTNVKNHFVISISTLVDLGIIREWTHDSLRQLPLSNLMVGRVGFEPTMNEVHLVNAIRKIVTCEKGAEFRVTNDNVIDQVYVSNTLVSKEVSRGKDPFG